MSGEQLTYEMFEEVARLMEEAAPPFQGWLFLTPTLARLAGLEEGDVVDEHIVVISTGVLNEQ